MTWAGWQVTNRSRASRSMPERSRMGFMSSGSKVSRPMTPAGAMGYSGFFSSVLQGEWSVAMQSMVPSRSAS